MAKNHNEQAEGEYMRLSMYLPSKIMKCIELLANDYLKDTQIKPYYVPYFVHIKYEDGLSQTDLKKYIPFDKSRISVVVRELIDEGFIYDSATGRNSSLHLTEKGIAGFSVCKMFIGIIDKELFNYSPEEKEFVRSLNLNLNKTLDTILAKYGKD